LPRHSHQHGRSVFEVAGGITVVASVEVAVIADLGSDGLAVATARPYNFGPAKGAAAVPVGAVAIVTDLALSKIEDAIATGCSRLG
jgi:hypothetical protein